MLFLAENAFRVMADNVYFLNGRVDVRDMVRLCNLNAQWQATVARQEGFWQLLRQNVIVPHSPHPCQATLRFQLGEDVRQVKKMGFELPALLGVEQMKFINLCARTLASVHLYSSDDQLPELPEGSIPLLELQKRVSMLFNIYLNPLQSAEWQQLTGYAPGCQMSAQLPATPAMIVQVHVKTYEMACDIARWVEAHKSHFGQLKIKQRNFKHASCCELPADIGFFVGLKKLDLRHAVHLPKEIAKLTCLQTLAIDNENAKENLYSVPSGLVQLDSLKKLNLVGCRIDHLPSHFKYLTNLTRLSLRRNRLDNFPAELFNLTRLQFLNLSSNQISHIDKKIKCMGSLEKLGLQHNKISRLPKSMASLPLKHLNVQHNPIHSLPEGLAVEKLYRPLETKQTKSQSTVASECEHIHLEKYLLQSQKDFYCRQEELQAQIAKASYSKKERLKAKLAALEKDMQDIEALKSLPFKQWKDESNVACIARIQKRIDPKRCQALAAGPLEAHHVHSTLNRLKEFGPVQCATAQPLAGLPPRIFTRAGQLEESFEEQYNRHCEQLQALEQIENDLTLPGTVLSADARNRVFSYLTQAGPLAAIQHRMRSEDAQSILELGNADRTAAKREPSFEAKGQPKIKKIRLTR